MPEELARPTLAHGRSAQPSVSEDTGHQGTAVTHLPPPATLPGIYFTCGTITTQDIDLRSLDAWEGALNLAGWPGLGGDGWAEQRHLIGEQ